MFKLQHTELNSFALSISTKNIRPWCIEVTVLRNGRLSIELAGLEKEVPSGGPGKVDFLAGQVNFKAHLPDGQVSRKVIL